jgi:hypothetical protein
MHEIHVTQRESQFRANVFKIMTEHDCIFFILYLSRRHRIVCAVQLASSCSVSSESSRILSECQSIDDDLVNLTRRQSL